MYQIEAGIWSRVFAVPSVIVDQHLKLCGALPLKVLLILLRHARPMDAAELAAMLSQSPGDIQDAVNYWVHLGVINQEASPAARQGSPPVGQGLSPAEQELPPAGQGGAVLKQDIPPAQVRREELAGGRRIVHLGKPRRLTMNEVNELAEEDKNIRALLNEAQAAFGRTLKPTESEAVVTICVRYETPPDLILMLMHYCISLGKGSMAYIEKVAQDWHEREIDTHEKVEAELRRLTQQGELEGAIRGVFGIYGRSITGREREFYLHWQKDLATSEALIKLAYERAVDAKGKISFAYINAILEDWHKKAITTPDAALRDMQGGAKSGKARPAGEQPASYDLDKFEELLQNGNIWD
jgi:DnaD/phage-associated family protein